MKNHMPVPPLRDEPIEATRNRSGFYRGKEFRLRGKSHLVNLTDQTWLKWAARHLSSDDDDNVILEINASIWTAGQKRKSGYFTGYVVFPNEELLDNSSLHCICDAESQTLADFAEEFIIHEIDPLEFCDGGELLFADLLEIRKEFQGHGLGILAFSTILQEMRKAYDVSVCLFQPHPLQYPSSTLAERANPKIRAAYRAAFNRLKSYYQNHLGAMKFAAKSKYWYARIADK